MDRAKMKFPIVELREHNLFVLMEFEGVFIDNIVQIRHNLAGNKTKYVVDSNGDLWLFTYVRTDRSGIRKIVGALWNISHDYYNYVIEAGITVARFREVVQPHLNDLDPDYSEMATALLESVAACEPSDTLRSHLHLLNL